MTNLASLTEQANGPGFRDENGEFQLEPMATGKELVVAPGVPSQTLKIENLKNDLQLIDGRVRHSNGSFVVRSLAYNACRTGIASGLSSLSAENYLPVP